MSSSADVVIVGAGCAGLSLAVALVDAGLRSRIVILDPRTEFGADRTWCFFEDAHSDTPSSVGAARVESCVTHSWSRWEVRTARDRVERAAQGVRYCRVPAERFYEKSLAALHGRADLVLGERVTSLVDTGTGVEAQTERGTIVRGRRAFDSRPASPAAADDAHIRLLQHFVGHVIETDDDVFEPGTATLMDFDVTQAHGIHFVYVLPFDARHALVESTFFTSVPFASELYDQAIDTYLRARFALRSWRVIAREQGAIPMTSAPHAQKASARVYRLGLAGGLAKPSTGYAFLAIQRFSRELARRLVTRDLPTPPSPRPPRTRVLDAVFLSYLARHPERAPELFLRLFARVEPRLLVRFLTDSGSAADDLRVMSAVGDLGLALETAHARRAWASSLFAR